jgi:BirA family biotin operon repressor/biotin-[acetyl-CoA-carboxylase] ligase
MTKPIGLLTHEWAGAQGLQSVYLPETDSTNRVAKDNTTYSSLPRLLYITDHQTHGRGRGTHTWSDRARGEQLLSSWVFHKLRPFQHTSAQLFGLALYQAAQATFPKLSWSLKAPNDLYLENFKVAGLLIEMVSGMPLERIIIGLGFNIAGHPERVPPASHLIAYEPAALEVWYPFLAQLLDHFSWAADEAQRTQLSDPVRQQLLTALNRFPLLSEPYLSVDADGNLTTASRHIRWTEL